LEDVLKHKTADSQFVDMLFGAMASSLGFETRVAFAANRRKNVFSPGYDRTNRLFIRRQLPFRSAKIGNFSIRASIFCLTARWSGMKKTFGLCLSAKNSFRGKNADDRR
jgi:hypothetical protein